MLFGTNSNPFFIIAKHVYTLQLFWLDCNRLRTKQFVGRRLLKSPSSCPAGRSWCGTSAANFIVHTFLGSKSVKNDSESGLHIKHQEFIHIFQQVHYMTIYIYIYNSMNTPHKSIQYNISVLEETLTSVLLGLSHIMRTWQGHNGTLKLCTLPGVDGSGAKGLATTAHCIGNSAQWRYGFLDRILSVFTFDTEV